MENLAELIYERKSCRSYFDDEIETETLDDIRNFIDNAKPLNRGINFRYEILKRDEVTLRTPWHAPYYIAIYSERKDNYMENVGFIFQQVSLYLQSLNLGNCWVGMGKPNKKDDDFIILISFGKSDDIKRLPDKFRRKSLDDISNSEDVRLKVAQLSPSAGNTQPWYFKQTSEGFDVYQVKLSIVKRKLFEKLNRIDVGIALADLYVSNYKTFEFEIKDSYDKLKGHTYIGSIKL